MVDQAALEDDLARLCHRDSRDDLAQLALAVSVHARDAEDFALAHHEGDVVEPVVLACFIEVHVAKLDHRLLLGLFLFIFAFDEVASDHQVCELFSVRLARDEGFDRLARAEDGHAVADMQHLAHLVADEDDALAFALELFDDGIETLDLDIGERRRWLVENQQLRAAIKRL